MHFLSLDQSLDLYNSGKLKKTNHGKEEDIVFEFSYFKNGFSGSIRIARTDRKDFVTKFDNKAYDLICPAVPNDFQINEKKIEIKQVTHVTHVDKETALLERFDGVSDEAVMLGAEAYKETDFLNYRISKEMWKLSIKPKTLTGWAWYSELLIVSSQSKNKIIPIKVRPLIDDTYNKQNKIVTRMLYSESYLISDFPELENISEFALKRMTENKIKSIIKEAIHGVKEHYEVFKFDKLNKDTKSGETLEKFIVYYDAAHEKTPLVIQFIELVKKYPPLDFNYKQYLTDDNNRLFINLDKIEQLTFNLINHIKNITNGQ